MPKNKGAYLKIISVYIFTIITVTAKNVDYPTNELTINSNCIIRNSGGLGTCKSIQDCPNIELNSGLTNIQHCYFDGNNPIVCCPKSDKIREKRVSRNFSKRKIINACYQEYARRKPNSGISCNFDRECVYKSCVSPSNGIAVPILDHMYTATLGWRTNGGNYDFKCGGFLVARNYVLTAAHCLRTSPDIVRMGDKVYSQELSQDITVVSAHIHPNYTRAEVYNDIALLRLSNAADDKFILACLWEDESKLAPDLRAIGFGATEFLGDPTDTLYQVYLELMDNQVCAKQFPVSSRSPNGIIGSQLCAGDTMGRMDTCEGDSGGPLFTKVRLYIAPECKIQDDIAHVLGVTSYGQVCGQSRAAVYTRIASYFDWIESIIFGR